MIVNAKCLFCEATIEGERDYMLSGTGLGRDGRRKPKWLEVRPEFHWTWNGLGQHIFYLCPSHKKKLAEGFEWCKKQMGGLKVEKLKEEIAKVIQDIDVDLTRDRGFSEAYRKKADQIVTLFQDWLEKEIGKLEVMDGEQIMALRRRLGGMYE